MVEEEDQERTSKGKENLVVEVNHIRVRVNLVQVSKEALISKEDSEEVYLMIEGEDQEEVLSQGSVTLMVRQATHYIYVWRREP